MSCPGELPGGVARGIDGGLKAEILFPTVPYRLKIFLADMHRPPAVGVNFSVDAFIRYTLTRASDGKVFFDNIVSGFFKDSVSKELVPARR